MPQSTEHLAILEILHVRSGVVAVTKSDSVDAKTLAHTMSDVKDRLAGSGLEDAPVIACSATSGEGLDALTVALDEVVAKTPSPTNAGRPRLWIDRVFTIAGAGTVVTGTLMGGTISTGMEVEIAPEGRRARIRALQSHKKSLDSAEPGNRVAINLAGLDRNSADRGDAIVQPGGWRATRRFDAHVDVLDPDLIGEPYELTPRGSHLLYVGTAETPVRIRLLGDERTLAGRSAVAQLHTRDPLVLQWGDRFVLRDAGRMLTFGGGIVLDPLPPHARRSDPDHAGRLKALVGADPRAALSVLVRSAGRIDHDEALFRSGVDDGQHDLPRLGRYLVSEEHLAQLASTVRSRLHAHHTAYPLEGGLRREDLRVAVELDAASFEALLQHVDDVVAEGSLLRLASFAVDLDPEHSRERDRIVSAIEGAGFSPPTEQELRVDPALIRNLLASGDLVRVGDFLLTRGRAEQARHVVRTQISTEGPQTVAQIRDALGTTRRYAVPLCEWLDSIGATRRQGDLRALGPRA
jgi:selenocysteine-specific elongation factor